MTDTDTLATRLDRLLGAALAPDEAVDRGDLIAAGVPARRARNIAAMSRRLTDRDTARTVARDLAEEITAEADRDLDDGLDPEALAVRVPRY